MIYLTVNVIIDLGSTHWKGPNKFLIVYDKGFVTIQAENYAVKYWPSKFKSELPGFHCRGYFLSQLNSSSWSGHLWHEDDAGAQHEGHLHGPSGGPRAVLARPGPQGHGHRRKEYSGEKRFLVLTPSWRALKEFIEVIKSVPDSLLDFWRISTPIFSAALYRRFLPLKRKEKQPLTTLSTG